MSVPDKSNTSSKKEAILKVEALKKHFTQNSGILDRVISDPQVVKAVDGVDLEIQQGETLAVVGESGCGKTTLAQTIIGLHEPTDGRVLFEGSQISGLSDRKRQPYRRNMQMIFQDPLASLNPRQTVEEILKTPMQVHDIGESDGERTEIAKSQLETVGLSPEHLNRHPQHFSGGQQQRIAIARALTVEPDVIIADEPVSSLDASVQAQILKLLERLQKELDLAILFIAHDLSVVKYISDRVAVMYLGQVVEIGPTTKLFEHPQHPYTKSLLSAVPRIGSNSREERIILEGTPPSPRDPPSGCRFHTRCPAIIPPNDWPGTQNQFRTGFGFKTRIESGGIDVDAVRTRLDAANEPSSDAAVKEWILERHFDGVLSSYPSEPRAAIERALTLYIESDYEAATDTLQSMFPTPCREKIPQSTDVEDSHHVSCHRVDSDQPGPPHLL
jgi:peptide/nickel transport system ATP-binding protein